MFLSFLDAVWLQMSTSKYIKELLHGSHSVRNSSHHDDKDQGNASLTMTKMLPLSSREIRSCLSKYVVNIHKLSEDVKPATGKRGEATPCKPKQLFNLKCVAKMRRLLPMSVVLCG